MNIMMNENNKIVSFDQDKKEKKIRKMLIYT